MGKTIFLGSLKWLQLHLKRGEEMAVFAYTKILLKKINKKDRNTRGGSPAIFKNSNQG